MCQFEIPIFSIANFTRLMVKFCIYPPAFVYLNKRVRCIVHSHTHKYKPHIFQYLSAHIHLSTYIFICRPICPHVCLCLIVWHYLYTFQLSISLSVCMYVYIYIYIYVYMCMCMCIYLHLHYVRKEVYVDTYNTGSSLRYEARKLNCSLWLKSMQNALLSNIFLPLGSYAD